jgi:hypothetical protein
MGVDVLPIQPSLGRFPHPRPFLWISMEYYCYVTVQQPQRSRVTIETTTADVAGFQRLPRVLRWVANNFIMAEPPQALECIWNWLKYTQQNYWRYYKMGYN